MPSGAVDYSLSDTWLLNHRVNRMLLDHLSHEQLAYAPGARARSIGDQFAHLHNVRVSWLEVSVPAAAKALPRPGKGAAKSVLHEALDASANAMAELLAAGKVKSARRGAIAFCGYLLAHEAHHRGQIILHLKHGGMNVDPKIALAIWDWQKI